ncbi:hypothetical protein B4U80_10339 [Leptotrombidium deliense]|uniref:Protein FAM173B-like protein n=1 Tax=Leptotrombidium deliense TaxID=299467 RepID=A0A443SMM2_9ACAR|nr:hypothetical protein B4U80_10339 [Leptotrombidium deliense]
METFNESLAKKYDSKSRKLGLFLGGACATTAVSILCICFPFVSPAFRKICLPFVPATKQQVDNVFRGLRSRKGKLVDLGSGDGRIVVEAAKRGFQATGVELNIFLVLYSKITARLKGVNSLTSFCRENLWNLNLAKFDNVVIFGVSEMMPLLEQKFQKELCTQKETIVVACRFPLLNKKPIEIVGSGIDTVWVYSFKSGSN